MRYCPTLQLLKVRPGARFSSESKIYLFICTCLLFLHMPNYIDQQISTLEET